MPTGPEWRIGAQALPELTTRAAGEVELDTRLPSLTHAWAFVPTSGSESRIRADSQVPHRRA